MTLLAMTNIDIKMSNDPLEIRDHPIARVDAHVPEQLFNFVMLEPLKIPRRTRFQ